MKTFATIDCETGIANEPIQRITFGYFGVNTEEIHPQRIVQIGVCIVDDGKVVGSRSWFVKPNDENDWLMPKNIHFQPKVTKADTENAEMFPKVWEKVKEFIGDRPLYSSNAKSAECSYFKNEFGFHNMDENDMPIINEGKEDEGCIQILCAINGIENINPHDAESDAVSLAKYMLKDEKIGYDGINFSKFVGKTIVFHGCHNKKFETHLKEDGVRITTSVSGQTDYLVCFDDKDCTKRDKANKLSIPIITIDEFVTMAIS